MSAAKQACIFRENIRKMMSLMIQVWLIAVRSSPRSVLTTKWMIIKIIECFSIRPNYSVNRAKKSMKKWAKSHSCQKLSMWTVLRSRKSPLPLLSLKAIAAWSTCNRRRPINRPESMGSWWAKLNSQTRRVRRAAHSPAIKRRLSCSRTTPSQS